MILPTPTECGCDEWRPSCICGFAEGTRLYDRLWVTSSINEAAEILKKLQVGPGANKQLHPADINAESASEWLSDKQHPKYPAYRSGFNKAGQQCWVYNPKEGN